VFVFGVGAEKPYDYFFRWSELPSKVSWKPTSEEFPQNLQTAAAAASSFLKSEMRVTNRMNLGQIRIRRLQLSQPLLEAHGKRPEDFAAQWLVAFTFVLQPEGPERTVVSLLDGSYATERPGATGNSKAKLAPRQRGEAQPSSDRKESAYRASRTDSAPPKNPYKEIHSQDFELPKVQWNPLVEGFPLSLKPEIQRARAHLTEKRSVPEDALSLEGISLEEFWPTEAALARNLNLLENMHHWLVVFQFCERAAVPYGHCVYMLLDGRILQETDEEVCFNSNGAEGATPTNGRAADKRVR
jgi:hypothetical protein